MALITDPSVASAKYVATKVRNALRRLVVEGTSDRLFAHGVVASDTEQMSTDPEPVTSVSFSANETGMLTEDGQNVRDVFAVRQVSFYLWEMILFFPVWTVTQLFDAKIMEDSIIPRDAENDIPQLSIRLQNIEWNHPPVQGAENGTRVKYEFQVVPGRA